MKLAKLTAVLCAAALTVTGLNASAAAPAPYSLRTESAGIRIYDENEDTMIVGGYEGEVPANLVIPAVYDGKKVIGIESYVFCGNRNIISLTLAGTIESVGREAFASCRRMESLTLEEGVGALGQSAFENCDALKSLTLPKSVESIGTYAFRGCSAMQTLVIPEGKLHRISTCAFEHCSSLTDVTVPACVSYIEDYAFNRCTNLKSITILNPKCEIRDYATTICNTSDGPVKGTYTGVIRGYVGSTAEKYAKENDYNFVPLDPENIVTTVTTARPDYIFEENGLIVNGQNPTLCSIAGTVDGVDEELVIPTVIRGKAVAVIETLKGSNSKIRSIVVPETVGALYMEAFANMPALESVTFLNATTRIPDDNGAICNDLYTKTPSFNGVIRGYAGSTAQKYAEKFGRKFEEIKKEQVTGTPAVTTTAAASETVVMSLNTGTTTSTVTVSDTAFDKDGLCLVNGIRYRNAGTHAEVVGYDSTQLSASMQLADEVNGLPVSVIAKGALSGCKGVKEWVIPLSVIGVDTDAFRNSPDLRNIKFLNPTCGFTDPTTMISNTETDGKLEYAGMITSFEGSPIQNYALAFGVPFLPIALLKGDFTFDGAVGLDDAQLVLRAYTEQMSGKEIMLTSQQIEVADTDLSGTLNVGDAQLILMYYTNRSVAGKDITWNDLLGK